MIEERTYHLEDLHHGICIHCEEESDEIPVFYQYCPVKTSHYRKPNIGMLENACREIMGKLGIDARKSEMLMIGDASGLPGQFSDTDRKTAENFCIAYMDVYDFTREFLPEQ